MEELQRTLVLTTLFIGVGTFRILGGGQGLEYWGAKFPAGT